MVRLIGRARRRAGCDDFDPSDLVLLHVGNAGVVSATGDAAPDAWRRVVALFGQSFEAPPPGVRLPASPSGIERGDAGAQCLGCRRRARTGHRGPSCRPGSRPGARTGRF